MLIKQIISAVAITLFAGTSYAWTLVYAHDSNGTATAGSLQTLRNAASNGSSIKAVVSFPGEHDWQLLCDQVSVRMGSSQDVLCSNTLDLWTQATAGAQFGIPFSPPQSASFALNTQGQYTHISVRKDNGTVILTNQLRQAMRWYAQ